MTKATELLHWIGPRDVYRCGSLVYLVNLKCASTYYADQFSKNNWKKQTAKDIDWSQDHVFSFIMDPMIRRAKGLAEFFCMYPQHASLLNQHPDLFKSLLYLDPHSLPYWLTFHSIVRKIDWIPIDQNYKSEDLVIKLCESHDIDIKLSYNKVHTSSQEKNTMYEKILEATGNGSAALYLGLEPDMFLYNDIIMSISPREQSWEKITWLKNTK
jgi:hypothetical protein